MKGIILQKNEAFSFTRPHLAPNPCVDLEQVVFFLLKGLNSLSLPFTDALFL